VDEKEIVGYCIAIEKYLVKGECTVGTVAEFQGARFLVVVCAVEDKSVYYVALCHVGKRLIHSEHIFAKRAAVASVPYLMLRDDEFAVGGKETEFRVTALVDIEKIALVCVNAGGDSVILYSVFK
jgi:hypothetical protein